MSEPRRRPGPQPLPIEERFWSKVDRRGPDDCWLWIGGRRGNGYGMLRVGSMADGTRRRMPAHRVSWELAHGAISGGLWVLHACDTPLCCNPSHLFLGTRADNMHDAVIKGRTARGERHGSQTHPERRTYGVRNGAYTHPERVPRGERHSSRTHPERIARGERAGGAKLTAAQVLEIRAAHASATLSGKELAVHYYVSPMTISFIINRKRWKHV